jgi:peptidoglycan/LPS O-acetylase OafA/YrhL
LALIAYWFSGVQPDYWAIVSNILLVQNVTGHSSNPAALWSLPFEVQMYLFLPALYVLAERAGGAAPRSLIIILLGSIGFVFFLWFIGLNYHLVKYVPCFLPGILAFTLRKTTLRIPSWSLFGYVVVVAIGFPWLVALGFRESLLLWPVCFVLGLLIPVSSEITSEFLQKLGKLVAKYSYGVYLVHGPCIGLAFGYLKGWAPIMQWLIFVLGTCGFSYIAYHMVEKPGINFGARLAGTVSKQKIFNPGLRATSND